MADTFNRRVPAGMVPSVEIGLAIDSLRVQGTAKDRLRGRFAREMRIEAVGEDAVRIGMASDRSTRPRNEDNAVAMLAHRDGRDASLRVVLVGVADGIGGHNDGDLASAIAIQTVTQHIVDELGDAGHKQLHAPSIGAMLMKAIYAAHQTIHAETAGGGSTITCALLIDNLACLAHIGDSRAYLLNSRRKDIELLTRDHRLVREWQDHGLLSEKQLEHHPLRHVLSRSIGGAGECQVDISRHKLASGSRLLLCTDGVWEALSRNEISGIVYHSNHPQEACERLIYAAQAHGAGDNVTAVLAEMPD